MMTTATSVIALIPATARANCLPNPTQNGTTTVCVGAETATLVVQEDGSDVLVESGATLASTDASSILVTSTLPSGNYVTNRSTIRIDGMVNGGSASAISVSSLDYTVQVRPAITVSGTGSIAGPIGIDLFTAGSGGTAWVALDNSGTISSSTGGLALRGSDDASGRFDTIVNRAEGKIGAIRAQVGSLTNLGLIDGGRLSAFSDTDGYLQYYGQGAVTNSGTIRSAGSADTVFFYRASNPGPYVRNSGLIVNDGTGRAVSGQAIISLVNEATGRIVAQGTAVGASTFVDVNNAGTITGGDDAIVSGSVLNLVNRGTINGSVRAAQYTSTIDNRGGTINGDLVLGDADDVFIGDAANVANPIGRITGRLDAGGGNDQLRFTFLKDTVLDAAIRLPDTIEQLALRVGNGSTLTLSRNVAMTSSLLLGGDSYSVDNKNQFELNGSITTQGPALMSDFSAPFGYGVTNNGKINATLALRENVAVNLSQVSRFTNNGTISAIGGGGVVLFYPGSAKNAGTITADGIAVNATGAFENSGTIHSSADVGLYLQYAYGASSTNSGVIQGAVAGVRLQATTLINSGTITSARTGIEVNGGRIENLSGGVITGGTSGIGFSTAYGTANGVFIANAGTINGKVDLGTSGSPYGSGNTFVALAGGIVNGDINLGNGRDVFATSLVNTGPGEFAGLTGKVTGSGDETLRYLVTADASVVAQRKGIFSALSYDLANNARLTLTSPATIDFGLGFAGAGRVDLTADMVGSGNATLLDLHQASLQRDGKGKVIPAAIDLVSRGTITVALDTPATYQTPSAVTLGAGDRFTNAGTILASAELPAADSGQPPFVVIRAAGGTTVNTGTIRLAGAVGIQGSLAYGEDAAVVVNSGVIEQQAGSAAATGIVDIGRVINSGQIRTGGQAIASGGAAVVINSGTLTSTSQAAIQNTYYSSYGRIDNQRGGTITGAGGTAISLRNRSLVQNAGTIQGDVVLNYNPMPYAPDLTGSGYVNRGGTLNGNLTLTDGDDLFVALDGVMGVSGVIDTGQGLDTFARGYSANASVSLDGLAAALPSGFERSGIASYGAGTTVTLTSASPYEGPLLLMGDGAIVNTATIITSPPGQTVQDSATFLRLGSDLDATSEFGAGSTLAFINKGRIESGVGGRARIFDNQGTINVNPVFLAAIAISASDASGFTFRNSGTITSGTAVIDQWYAIDRIAQMTIDNSGVIGDRLDITAKAERFTFTNSGQIGDGALGYQKVIVNLGQASPFLPPADAEEASFANSGTLAGGLVANLWAKRASITNSGAMTGALLVAQVGGWTADHVFGEGYTFDRESLALTNTGTIGGIVELSGQVPVLNIDNRGSMGSSLVTFGDTTLSASARSVADQTITLTNSGTIANAGLAAMAVNLIAQRLASDGTATGTGNVSVKLNNTGAIRADGGAVYTPVLTYPWNGTTTPATIERSVGLQIGAQISAVSDVAIANAEGATISAAGATIFTPFLNWNEPGQVPAAFRSVGSTAVDILADRLSLDNAGTIRGVTGGTVPSGTFLLGNYFPGDAPTGSFYLAGAIRTTGSADTITNRSTGVIAGSIDLGDKDDVLVNLGRIEGDVFMGDGNDSVVQGIRAVLAGTVDGGAGVDTAAIDITGGGALSGAMFSSFVGFENHILTGAGAVTANGALPFDTLSLRDASLTIDAGQALQTSGPIVFTSAGGVNRVVNRGTIAGGLDLGQGSNTLINSGRITGGVTFGIGDDVLEMEGAGAIAGPVNAGGGNDALRFTFAGTNAAPSEIDLSRFTGFEHLQVKAGTGAYSATGGFGTIAIDAGRLIGRGGSVLTGNVAVANGATFGSAGTVVGNVTVASGGTLSPGASPGTMTVQGNVSLAGGSVTLFEFTPTVSDKLLISGNLTVANGAALTLTGERPLMPGTAYDLIVADGGINGAFTTINKAPTVLGFLRQTDTRLQLLGTFITPTGTNRQTAASIDHVNAVLTSGKASGALLASIPLLLDASGSASTAAFTRLTPEAYATAQQLAVEHGLAVAKAGRLIGAAAPPLAEARGFVFAQGMGDKRRLQGNSAIGSSAARSSSYGVLGGIGYGSASGSIAAFVGHIDSDQHIAALGASTDARGVFAGLAGHVAVEGFDIDMLVAQDWSRAHTQRALPGAVTVKSARYDLHSLVLNVEVGYRLPVGSGWSLRPEIGITHVRARRGATQETGSPAFALDVASDQASATFVDAAVDLRIAEHEGATIHPRLKAGVRHQLAGSALLASGGLSGTGLRFDASGAQRKRTLAVLGAGVAVDLTPRLSVFANYDGELGQGAGSNSGNLGVHLAF